MIRLGNFMPQPTVLGAKKIGQLWTPKNYTNFAKIDATAEDFGGGSVSQRLSDTVTIQNSTQYDYTKARTNAMSWAWCKSAGELPGERMKIDEKGHMLGAGSKASVTLVPGGEIVVNYRDGRDPLRVALDQDVRISWSDSGDPLVQKGAAALTDGVLKAAGKDEVLIRLSGADVEAGENTMVVNFSADGGRFSGGSNVEYRGAYTDSVFEYKSGKVDFTGYFESSSISTGEALAGFDGVFDGSTITAGDVENVFSGHFNGGSITAGNEKNVFDGTFLGGSSIKSGSGNDFFSGAFVDTIIDAGEGDNEFGQAFKVEDFNELESWFANTVITAGGGNDSVFGVAYDSSMELGDGDNDVKGVFTGTTVKSGNGDDRLTSMYSRNSIFNSGGGNDFVALGTAVSSNIVTNDGVNEVVLGYNMNAKSAASSIYGGGDKLGQSAWFTKADVDNGIRGKKFGEIEGNRVDASEGENTINVNSGEGTHVVRTGTIINKEDEAAEQKSPDKPDEDEAAEAGEAGEEAASAPEGDGDSAASGLIKPREESEDKSEENKEEVFAAEDIQRFLTVSGDRPRTDGVIGVIIDGGVGKAIGLRAHDRNKYNFKLYEDGKKSMAGYKNAFNGSFSLPG